MIEKPPDIVDRDREWETLRKIHARRRPELVFVVGRRRVGKSFVLSRFARATGGLYFQATRRSAAEQLAALSRVIGEHFGDDLLRGGTPFASWDALFDYLTRKAGTEPTVVVLDEFPYLVDAVPELPSVIQRLWDHDWQGSRIRLVLSGSYISAMQRLEAADQPLYGRRTARIAFQPFTARDAGLFVEGWTARDKMRLYGTVGPLPGHLALVDPEADLGANIAELFLDPSGRLVDDAQHTLDAFVVDASIYYSILAAAATGDRRWSGITSRVGRTGGAILRPMQWLEEMQLLARVVPITEKQPAKSKRAQYRVIDPQVVFWHAVIAPLVQGGSIGLVDPAQLWSAVVAPKLDDHMGGVFEQICREWVAREKQPFAPLRLGSWWDAKSRNEIDIAAVSDDGELFVAECKWGGVTQADFRTLKDRAQLLAAELGHVRNIRYGLFTGNGAADDAVRAAAAAREVLLVGPDDLV